MVDFRHVVVASHVAECLVEGVLPLRPLIAFLLGLALRVVLATAVVRVESLIVLVGSIVFLQRGIVVHLGFHVVFKLVDGHLEKFDIEELLLGES